MDDSRPLRFFLQPTETLHRRYEALRAYFVERQSLGEVAQRFGYRYTALRDLICDFRAQCRRGDFSLITGLSQKGVSSGVAGGQFPSGRVQSWV